MPASVSAIPMAPHLLIVDDEPDVHAVTRLSLRGLRYRNREVKLTSASSGAEAVQIMNAHPEVGVILLDVVMETTSAGLDACRAIREELGNRFVRILLRTGQPGAAPEKQTIDEFDIDGYLPKAELTTNRLYAAVRTALKAWEELVELERHRKLLAAIHDCVVSLRSFEPLETTLGRILETAVTICPTPLAMLELQSFEKEGNPRRWFVYLSTDPDPTQARAAASAVAARIAHDPAARVLREGGRFGEGFLVPLVLHRELGYGWMYLETATADSIAEKALPLLAAHAANALYSGVAQRMLSAREGSIYETMII
jgi:CheY-like chemotaxis protein